MARTNIRLTALALALLALIPGTSDAASTPPATTFTQQTIVDGNTVWDYLSSTSSNRLGESIGKTISTHPREGASCGLWSKWDLYYANTWNGIRKYRVSVYDGCNQDQQVYPKDEAFCSNDGGHYPDPGESYCYDAQMGHIPVGLTPDSCTAGADQYVLLNASINPISYDGTKDTTLTATTSFGNSEQSFVDQLSQSYCTDVLNWSVVGWTFSWSDGTTNSFPGTEQSPMSTTHVVKGSPANAGQQTMAVTAIAHLHIIGTAEDFDSNGNLYTRQVDTYVNISNVSTANGSGSAPAYTPPQLQVGGVGIDENSDGIFPAYSPTDTPLHHLQTIRGRLLQIYPEPVVITPGTETIDGVSVGAARTTTTTWQYLGEYTDAPMSEQTQPGSQGPPGIPIQVQWNHAEIIGSDGTTVDELVPLTINAHTVYPDGHVENETITDSIPVTIYYIGLNYS